MVQTAPLFCKRRYADVEAYLLCQDNLMIVARWSGGSVVPVVTREGRRVLVVSYWTVEGQRFAAAGDYLVRDRLSRLSRWSNQDFLAEFELSSEDS